VEILSHSQLAGRDFHAQLVVMKPLCIHPLLIFNIFFVDTAATGREHLNGGEVWCVLRGAWYMAHGAWHVTCDISDHPRCEYRYH
jgi:hypothetical protein